MSSRRTGPPPPADAPRRVRAGRPRLAGSIVAVIAVAALGLAGCATDDVAQDDETTAPGGATTGTTSTTPAGTSSPTTPSSTPTDDAVVIAVTVTGRTVTTASDTVDVSRGQTVRLVVTGDAVDNVHVHGYDHEADLAPGVPATIEFVADVAGSFEVETHESGLLLVKLNVRP